MLYENLLWLKHEDLFDREAAAELRKRFGFRGDALNNALTRYFVALSGVRKTLSGMFTAEENGLMVEAFCSTGYSHASDIKNLPWTIEGAIRYEYLDQKWGVNGEKLVEKLASLDYLECVALLDAIERWWNLEDNQQEFGELLNW